jgi:hypothetical protein
MKKWRLTFVSLRLLYAKRVELYQSPLLLLIAATASLVSISIAFGHDRGCGTVLDHGYFKAAFQEFAQMRFHAEVRRHAGKYHLVDATLAKLQQ